jgi:transposase
MSGKKYSREFREEAVRQVTERGYSVRDVAARIGVSTHSLYKWVRAARPASGEASELAQSVHRRSPFLLRAPLNSETVFCPQPAENASFCALCF